MPHSKCSINDHWMLKWHWTLASCLRKYNQSNSNDCGQCLCILYQPESLSFNHLNFSVPPGRVSLSWPLASSSSCHLHACCFPPPYLPPPHMDWVPWQVEWGTLMWFPLPSISLQRQSSSACRCLPRYSTCFKRAKSKAFPPSYSEKRTGEQWGH